MSEASRPRRLLFVCTANKLRSPTAEAICRSVAGIEARSAGTHAESGQLLTGDLIEWADIVIVMERQHRNSVTKTFREQLGGKQLFVLNIPDEFEYMQPELVSMLKHKLGPWIGD